MALWPTNIRHGALYSVALLLLSLGAASADNPPTNYTPATTPYGGSESWYCEVVTGTLNRRCSFADVVASITALTNLVTVGTLTGGTASTGFTINAANVTWSGVIPQSALTSPANTSSTPSDPTGTTNTTGVMMGLAGTITPATTGKILAIVTGGVSNNTSSDGCSMRLRTGTGTAPTNGTGLVGTASGALVQMSEVTGGFIVPFTVAGTRTGLGIGTAVWIDISLAAITGGTCAVTGLSVYAIEQ